MISFAWLLVSSSSSSVFAFSPMKSSVLRSSPSIPSTTALHMAGTLTLYGHPGTRSPLVNWGALEVGLDITMGNLRNNPHPFGQLPCLTDDDGSVLLFESGAILQYFHQLTKEKLNLSKADAAMIMSWITWANASLDPICFLETPEGRVYDTGLKRPNKRIDRLNEILAEQSYLIGDTFTLADVAVASYLLYVVQFFPDTDLSRWPHVMRYMNDCATRPTYGQAFGQDEQAYILSRLSPQDENAPSKKNFFGMF